MCSLTKLYSSLRYCRSREGQSLVATTDGYRREPAEAELATALNVARGRAYVDGQHGVRNLHAKLQSPSAQHRGLKGPTPSRAAHGVGNGAMKWQHLPSSYWLAVPVASWGMACHSFQYLRLPSPQNQYLAVHRYGTVVRLLREGQVLRAVQIRRHLCRWCSRTDS